MTWSTSTRRRSPGTITEGGIETSDGERAFDIIVWATGFDGFTGALTRMDVIGEGGQALGYPLEGWRRHLPSASMVPGFPNLFMAGGPHMIGGNFPRATEIMVDYVTAVLRHACDGGYTYVAADPEAGTAWTEEVHEAASIALMAEKVLRLRSANIPGKKHEYLAYAGSLTKFRERMDAMEQQGYPGVTFGAPVPT